MTGFLGNTGSCTQNYAGDLLVTNHPSVSSLTLGELGDPCQALPPCCPMGSWDKHQLCNLMNKQGRDRFVDREVKGVGVIRCDSGRRYSCCRDRVLCEGL